MSASINKNVFKAPAQRYVAAQFDFSPSVPEELSLKSGDVIMVTGKIDDFWSEGIKLHNGVTGQFPNDFVQDVEVPRCYENEILLYTLDTFYPEASEDLPFDKGKIIVLERRVNDEWGFGRTASKVKGMFPLNYTEKLPLTIPSVEEPPSALKLANVDSSSPGLGHAKALMSLTAQLDEELSFSVGDEIKITKVLEDGAWYQGQLGTKTGSFPASFVKLMGPLKTSEIPNSQPRMKSTQDLTKRKPGKDGDVSSDLKLQNDKSVAMKKDNPKPGTASCKSASSLPSGYRCAEDGLTHNSKDAGKLATSAEQRRKTLYTVRALYNFTGNTSQELSFEKGTCIPITEEVDDHWLMGMVNDKNGYVPRTYVSVGDKPPDLRADRTKQSSNRERNFSGDVPCKNYNVGNASGSSSNNYVKMTGASLMGKRHVYSKPDSSTAGTRAVCHKTVPPERGKGRKAVVVYDYQAGNHFDLSLFVGDTVWVLREVDENWSEVTSESGRKGIVPTSYIQVVTGGKDPVPVSSLPCRGRYASSDSQRVTTEGDVDSGTEKDNVYSIKPLSSEQRHYRPKTTQFGSVPDSSISSALPLLLGSTDTDKCDGNNFNTSKNGLILETPNLQRQTAQRGQTSCTTNSRVLHKSVSVDNFRQHARGTSTSSAGRRRYQSGSRHTADPRVHLEAWKSAMSKGRNQEVTNKTICVPECNDTNPSDIRTKDEAAYDAPISSSNSAGVREKSTNRVVENNYVDRDFVKNNSDSDISIKSAKGQTKRSNGIWRGDSVSTASTGSSSSYDGRRATIHIKTPHRSAPPIPPHSRGTSKSDQPLNLDYPVSHGGPQVPKRVQSLHHDSEKVHAATVGATQFTKLRRSRTTPGTLPALDLPPQQENQALKKLPPTRPVTSATVKVGSENLTNGKESVRNVTSSEMKDKMEKLRSDIEEYSRMKRDLEALYKGTHDGKERKEIAENMEFVKANLKRLQKEFQDVIAEQQDHIYESIDIHMKQATVEDGAKSFNRLQPPTLPPPMESPGTLRKKRKEKRLLVMTEIVDTERDFLTDVTVTIHDIMDELIDREIPQTTVSTLFGNIVEVREFSSNFLCKLEESLMSECNPKEGVEAVAMGEVFIDNIPEMKEVYMTYCRNHDDSIAVLEKLETDPELMHVVTDCLENMKTKVNVFDLGSFLIKPVQRILKYPLLIAELIKLTDQPDPNGACPSDLDKLVLASKMMQDVANDINESKRTKDLVRKYKNAQNQGMAERLGRISIKTLKKKSTRLSRRLGNVTGINSQGIRDSHFDEIERRFKTLERALKNFKANVIAYCDRCRDTLCTELNVAKGICDVVVMPERTHPVAKYQFMVDKMSGPIYRQFHDQVQLRALSPISLLLVSFEAPQAIITKRYDKLIDFERLEKNSDSNEKLQAAKHDYEALNKSLLDELPRLSELGVMLLCSCTSIFAQLCKDFERKLLEVLKPLLIAIQQTADVEPKVPSNMEIQERFHPTHIEVAAVIAGLQMVPASFGSMFGVGRTPSNLPKKQKPPVAPRPVPESAAPKQLPEDRQALLDKYRKDQLYVVLRTYTASRPMDIGCQEGDLVSVLKQQDPMGTSERWFVDRGGTGKVSTGFLPSNIITPHNPTVDRAAPPSYSTSTAHVSTPTNTQTQRQKSPTPALESTSSTGIKPPPSPFSIREKLATLNKDGTLAMDSQSLTEAEILEAFAEEDEIFDAAEYGEVSTSPQCAKQHFRAEYEFIARSDLELTMHVGDIVKLIMAHDTEGNTEWWLVSDGERRQGYVPFNYLTKAEYL